MQQIGNPSHLDPGRVAVPAGILAGAVTGYAASSLALGFGVVLGMAVGAAVAVGLLRHLTARVEARKAAALEEEMRARAGERRKQLARAQASGALERFPGERGGGA